MPVARLTFGVDPIHPLGMPTVWSLCCGPRESGHLVVFRQAVGPRSAMISLSLYRVGRSLADSVAYCCLGGGLLSVVPNKSKTLKAFVYVLLPGVSFRVPAWLQ